MAIRRRSSAGAWGAGGENVGSYAIGEGTLSAGSNYTIGFIGNNLTITPATLGVTADPQSKVYGQGDPGLTYAATGFENGDTSSILSGGLERAGGENVGSYAIGEGTLSAGGNYTIGFIGNNLTITPATLGVTANPQSKVYGQGDPGLTYAATGFENGDTSSILSGCLGRAGGENVGSYAIGEGTLSAGSNYTIGFIGNNLTITPATLGVTADPQSKVYGQGDPGLTYAATGFENGDTSSILSGGLGAQGARTSAATPSAKGRFPRAATTRSASSATT